MNSQDQSNNVYCMKKTRQDNNMTNGIDSLYVENKTKLLRLIQRGMIYDKDKTGQ